MVTTSVSLVLITSNASTNFFIYCFVNNAFREELSRHWKVLTRRSGIDRAYNFALSWRKRKPEVVVLDGDNVAFRGYRNLCESGPVMIFVRKHGNVFGDDLDMS